LLVVLDQHQVALEDDSNVAQVVMVQLVETLGINLLHHVSLDEAEAAVDRD